MERGYFNEAKFKGGGLQPITLWRRGDFSSQNESNLNNFTNSKEIGGTVELGQGQRQKYRLTLLTFMLLLEKDRFELS